MNSNHKKLAYEEECHISNAFTIMGEGKNSGCNLRYSDSCIYCLNPIPVPNEKNPQRDKHHQMKIKMGKMYFFMSAIEKSRDIK